MTHIGVLPASGTRVLLREPTGADELVVRQSHGPAAVAMLGLARRLVSGQGQAIEWDTLPAVELTAIALLIRRCWLGDLIRAEAMCPLAGCEEAIDVPVNIDEYIEHHRPSRYRGLRECAPGWFTLMGGGLRFRLPTIGDLMNALDGRAGSLLLERCIEPASLPSAGVRRVERALETIAPRLDSTLRGTCPACGNSIELRFEPIGYVLEELRDACSELFAQVHELAFAYHWSEGAILALERSRRHAYVQLIRSEAAFA